jgi:dTDP-glucose pyrophosphorylase
MKPTLLILAAGLGARYGGLKQIDPVGPNGEILIDYSIYDAMKAGFGKLVFVIRHYFENAFREKIGSKFDDLAETAYAYQELDACIDGFEPPKDRDKPWGTGHAVLVAGDLIDGPFAVINADDYYGPASFKTMAQFLTPHLFGNTPRSLGPSRGLKIGAGSSNDYAMVGYTLRDTLSEYGPVSRGVCQCDEGMYLRRVVERKKVEKTAAGARYFDDDGTEHLLSGDEIVSMNLWGFQPSIFLHLESHLRRFLKEQGSEKNAELYIPTVVDDLIERGKATVKVLHTNDVWFGVTYRRDAAIAAGCIRRLIDQGLYPENLWERQ